MKKTIGRLIIISGILIILMNIGFISGTAQLETRNGFQTVDFTQIFSKPIIQDRDTFIDISVQEANTVTTDDGSPLIPVFSKTFTFPWRTRILSVEITPSSFKTLTIEKQVQPVPIKQQIKSGITPNERVLNSEVYGSSERYPTIWGQYSIGSGLDTANNHVLFLSCHLYPVQYLPQENLLHYINQITVHITYEVPLVAPTQTDAYDLVIIAPEEFSDHLQPLVTHKNTYGITATLATLEDLYSSTPGRDNPEKIKYFVKHAVEDWDTKYILLVGDVKKLPIRVTYASWWEPDILSDLYYADLYDSELQFCSWDGNENNKFGETDHNGNDIDGVDLYADVHIGRLPCSTTTEVDVMVDKIIRYEQETADQLWFKNIIVAGGDTFPPGMGAEPSVFEGEITNEKVLQQVPDFSPIKLWSSTHNLRATTFNRAITNGAGFVSYAGHGFEHGWGTYRPNALRRAMNPLLDPVYFTPFIDKMNNGYKLPILFWDACLTAKLDFNVTDLADYYPILIQLLTWLNRVNPDPSVYYPCFAWSLLKKEDGGAIATVGSTRTAYTRVDANGVYGGAGYLDVHFFKGYHEGVTVGEMMTAAQNDYINNVGADYFTIEEFILLGDPSLHVGGF